MLKKLHYSCLFLLLLAFFTCFYGQNTSDSAQQVELSLAGDKKIYRLGEPIDIVLTFTAKSGTLLCVNGLSSRLDEILLSPAKGVVNWKEKSYRAFGDYEHTFAYNTFADQPISKKFSLNSHYRFTVPGKYSLKIKTKRMRLPETDLSKGRFSGTVVPLTTNTVEFEVKAMSQAEEIEEIRRLSALIDSQKDWRVRDTYVQELSFLTGDAATREKVRRLLSKDNGIGNSYHILHSGLIISPNKLLAVELLENAFRDLSREDASNLISMLTTLRFLAGLTEEDSEKFDLRKISSESANRQREIQNGYLEELVESLPHREGNNKFQAAMSVFALLPRDDASSRAYLAARKILIDSFDNLDPYAQNRLLESYWERIKNPSSIASLEKILSHEKPVQSLNNAIALKRLVELDKIRARPFVIREICNPDSIVDPEALNVLDDKFLPETDGCLVNQLKKFAEDKTGRGSVMFRLKALFAARYATAKIYPELMEVYKTYGDKLGRDAQASILGYFARHNDKEAMVLVEWRLKNIKEMPISNFFGDLTRVNFTKGMENILKRTFEETNPYEAGSAAYFLSRYGGRENRKLLEKRYESWRKEWLPRRQEFNAPQPSPEILAQRMFQINLVTSLKDGKSWKLTDQEKLTLRQSCFSDQCRNYFSLK